jgi:hypothetical protein
LASKPIFQHRLAEKSFWISLRIGAVPQILRRILPRNFKLPPLAQPETGFLFLAASLFSPTPLTSH